MSLVRIDELFKFEKGYLQSSKSVAGNYPFITAAEKWKTHKEYSHECEALIFAAAASGSLGRTHYVNGKFITSDLCFLLTPRDGAKYPIDLKFYHIIFQSYKDDIVKNTKAGTSKEAIGLKNFGKYKLPYYNIDLQRELRKIFELSGITKDKLIQQQFRQIDLLKKLRQQILQDAVQGKLVPQDPNDEPASVLLGRIKTEKELQISNGKLPKERKVKFKNEICPFALPHNWIWCRLSDIAEAIDPNPSHRMPQYVQVGVPFISTENFLPNDTIDFNIGKKVTDNTLKEHIGRYEIHDNSFAFSRIGTIGKTIKLPLKRDYCLSHALSVINPFSKELNLRYLRFVMSTNFIIRQAKKDVKSISVPDLGMAKIRDFFIPLPPQKEQYSIVTKVEQLMILCDELEKTIQQNQKYTQDLLQVTLKEALEPQNNSVK